MAYPAEQAQPNDGRGGSADRGKSPHLLTSTRTPIVSAPGTSANRQEGRDKMQGKNSRTTLFQPDLKVPLYRH